MSTGEKFAAVGDWSGWVTLGWAGAFAYLGLTAVAPVPEVTSWDHIDLIGHAGASFLLAALLSEWLVMRRAIDRSAGLMAAGLGALAFGLLIETLQTGRPTRSFEMADVFADLIGAALGPWVWGFASRSSRSSGVRSVVVVSVGILAIASVAALVVFTG